MVNPETRIDVEVPDASILPLLSYTKYRVMIAPPLLSGAVNDIVMNPFPGVATTDVGSVGVPTSTDTVVELSLVPFSFMART